jgi:hypothetical protein
VAPCAPPRMPVPADRGGASRQAPRPRPPLRAGRTRARGLARASPNSSVRAGSTSGAYGPAGRRACGSQPSHVGRSAQPPERRHVRRRRPEPRMRPRPTGGGRRVVPVVDAEGRSADGERRASVRSRAAPGEGRPEAPSGSRRSAGWRAQQGHADARADERASHPTRPRPTRGARTRPRPGPPERAARARKETRPRMGSRPIREYRPPMRPPVGSRPQQVAQARAWPAVPASASRARPTVDWSAVPGAAETTADRGNRSDRASCARPCARTERGAQASLTCRLSPRRHLRRQGLPGPRPPTPGGGV